jgi:hypothetical protein
LTLQEENDYANFRVSLKNFKSLNKDIGPLLYYSYCPKPYYNLFKNELTCRGCDGVQTNVLNFRSFGNTKDYVMVGERPDYYFVIFM